MTRWEKTYPPTPFDGAPVLPWPSGSAPPDLPEGKAGISVWIRTRRTDNKHYVEPKAVGVDGLPVWHGVGRMVAVTEPGEHLVEVWAHGSAETVRGIRAEAGQVAELDYRMPASMGGAEGVLVPAPGSRRRRMGSGVRWGWVPILVVSAAWLIDEWRDLPETSAVGVGVLVCAVLAGVLAVAVKQRADRRYRVRMSDEAGARRESPKGTWEPW